MKAIESNRPIACAALQLARGRAAYALRQFRKTKSRLWWNEYHNASQWAKRILQ